MNEDRLTAEAWVAWSNDHVSTAMTEEEAVQSLLAVYPERAPPYRVACVTLVLPRIQTVSSAQLVVGEDDERAPMLTVVK